MIVSTIIVQSLWRGIKGRNIAKTKYDKYTALALKIQPLIRGWLYRNYIKWMKTNYQNAVQIQKTIRGYLGSCCAKKYKWVDIQDYNSYNLK